MAELQLDQPLTKKDFWLPLEKDYPYATKAFYRWLDEYSEKAKWNEMFHNHSRTIGDSICLFNMPYAFQLGTFLIYMSSTGRKSYRVHEVSNLAVFIRRVMELMLEPEAYDLAEAERKDIEVQLAYAIP